MLKAQMRNKSGNALLLAVGIAIGLSLGLTHGVLADKPAALGADLPWQDAHMLAAVLERVKHDYVNPVDDHQLLQAAIRGMVASLDPYSAYLDGDEYDDGCADECATTAGGTGYKSRCRFNAARSPSGAGE